MVATNVTMANKLRKELLEVFDDVIDQDFLGVWCPAKKSIVNIDVYRDGDADGDPSCRIALDVATQKFRVLKRGGLAQTFPEPK